MPPIVVLFSGRAADFSTFFFTITAEYNKNEFAWSTATQGWETILGTAKTRGRVPLFNYLLCDTL